MTDPRDEKGTPDVDAFSHSILLVLADAMENRIDSAVDRFEEACPSPRDGFAAMCGFANIITTAGVAASPPDATGPVIVELERLPGGKSDAIGDLSASDIAGFLGAVGNDDYAGAWTVFWEACCTDGDMERGARFIATLLMMTATVAADSNKGAA